MSFIDIENKSYLKQYIDSDGNFNYKAMKNDYTWLEKQIDLIENENIENLSKTQLFVFYLNSYNLLTLKNVFIELDKNPRWNGNTNWFRRLKFFVFRKFPIGGRKISLYTLENKILRKKFKDPRIHFAINCASTSCPVLPAKLFEEKSIDDYLTNLTHSFINNDMHVKIDNENKILSVNPIFKWYKNDFEPDGVISFISRYREDIERKKLKEFKLEFLKYDWSLNNQ